jgi:UDP-N-acetylmuramyl pentapeptide phosphotransferase/UDP-N-acetylglucosamine-1-phosphate transferase/dTDP-4-dehydrorhamnose reductase
MVAAAVSTLVLSLAAPLAAIPLLKRFGVIDVPNDRSSHTNTATRGVGVAVAFALAGGFVVFSATEPARNYTLLGVVVAAALVAALLGWLDDIREIRVGVRALGQLLIGVAVALAAAALVGAQWWQVPLAAIFVAGYINVANFMDGINGISSLHGAVAGAAYAVVGALVNEPWMMVAGLLLGTAFLGFLPWNAIRKGTFLGDVGSYLLGSGLAAVAVIAIISGVPVVSALAPLAIYLADTGVTLARRVARGERWYEGHRSHAYQRLTDSGLAHLLVAALVALATALTSVLGLVALRGGLFSSLLSAAAIVLVAVSYLVLPRFRAKVPTADRAPAVLPASDLPASAAPTARSVWAVVGASGFIGGALVKELTQTGCDVRLVSAPRFDLASSSIPVDVISAAHEQRDALSLLASEFAGVDVVVNAAGLASPDADSEGPLFGANALLPLVVALAADQAGATRYLHLSSAAVQGRKQLLDETLDLAPFSPYSRSKALGEQALCEFIAGDAPHVGPEIAIIRATSVQGSGRKTTESLARIARSRLSSVARPGTQPTVVSSLRGLVEFVLKVGMFQSSVPTIVLQPWERLSARDVLEIAGGRPPLLLPRFICRFIIVTCFALGGALVPFKGVARRLELMWFGQAQDAAWARSVGLEVDSHVRDVFDFQREVAR